MVALYLLAGTYVLFINSDQILGMLKLIFVSAFSTHDASGAFVGGTMGYAFMYGMKRALFSNEAGQGSSPIAHSAAKTDEPVREGVVAGLEPFIDTLIVCTFSALVILSTGVWNRGVEARYDVPPEVVPVALGEWSLETKAVPSRDEGEWVEGELVFAVIQAQANPSSGNNLHRLNGTVVVENGTLAVDWKSIESSVKPVLNENGVYGSYVGATLTAKAFDSVTPGLGKWLITLAVWLFAISTIISWSYYGEQGIVYLIGNRAVLGYKLIYCSLIVVATLGHIKTDDQLDNLTSLGTGVMLLANIPIIWIFGKQHHGVYGSYVGATLTAKAFDSVTPGLGKWLITLAVWLFAISTIISWSYYGEQGIVYLIGNRAVLGYKLIYCSLIVVATLGHIKTDDQLDNLTSLGTGVMLLANIPIIWIFGKQAMNAYHNYVGRLKSGRMGPGHAPPPLDEVISGRDVD